MLNTPLVLPKRLFCLFLANSYIAYYMWVLLLPTGIDVGGNNAHLAPEILNARPGPRKFINYTKQPVWAAGVLAYEFAGHRSPFQSGVSAIDQRGYSVNELPPLRYTYCNNSKYCQALPSDLTALVKSMLEMNPSDRPLLQSCLRSVSRIVQTLN